LRLLHHGDILGRLVRDALEEGVHVEGVYHAVLLLLA
jgi:hypothetical protein